MGIACVIKAKQQWFNEIKWTAEIANDGSQKLISGEQYQGGVEKSGE